MFSGLQEAGSAWLNAAGLLLRQTVEVLGVPAVTASVVTAAILLMTSGAWRIVRNLRRNRQQRHERQTKQAAARAQDWSPVAPTLVPRSLLSPIEKELFAHLQAGLPAHTVFAQVGASAFLKLGWVSPEWTEAQLSAICATFNTKVVDFVIADERLELAAVVLVRDSRPGSSREPPAELRRVLGKASCPVLELDLAAIPSDDHLPAWLAGARSMRQRSPAQGQP